MKHIFFSLVLLASMHCVASDDWTLMQYHEGSTTYQFQFTPQEETDDAVMRRYVVDVTTLYDEITPYGNGVETEQCAVDLTTEEAKFLAEINSPKEIKSPEEIKAFIRALRVIE